jgi:hypothetical protein
MLTFTPISESRSKDGPEGDKPSGPPIADDADRAIGITATDLADSPPARQAASTQRRIKMRAGDVVCLRHRPRVTVTMRVRRGRDELKCLTGDCDAGQALSERCVGGHGRCAVRSTDNVGTKLTVNRDTSVPIATARLRRSGTLWLRDQPGESREGSPMPKRQPPPKVRSLRKRERL